MKTSARIYDISVVLGSESIDFPGDPPFVREQVGKIGKTGVCDLSLLRMSAHAGTHLDCPAHFVPGGRTVDQYPPESFLLPAAVVRILDPEAVTVRELAGVEIREGDALLFKTDNSTSGRSASGAFVADYVYVSAEAARFCAERRVKLVGIDYISIERYGDQAFPAHRTLSGQGILILEGIRLDHVPEGRYVLSCLPLRIQGCEASPVRAILLPASRE